METIALTVSPQLEALEIQVKEAPTPQRIKPRVRPKR